MGAAKRFWGRIWRTLASMRLAAILLAALLLSTLVTSIFPQLPRAPVAHEAWLSAVALRYGAATSLLHRLGLFDAYHSPWYLALLAALALNTLACTLRRLPGRWRRLTKSPVIVRPDGFYLRSAQRAEWSVSSLDEGLQAARDRLGKRRYRVIAVRSESTAHLLAEKRSWSQMATLVSHFTAMVLALALLARPALARRETDVTLLPGQVRAVAGEYSVRAGSLTIERHPDGQPSNYRVPVAILEGASPAVTRTVRVNHPLNVGGAALHLQSYGPAATVATPERTFDLAFTSSQAVAVSLPDSGVELRVAYQPESENLFVEARSAEGAVLGSGVISDGDQVEILGTPVTFSLTRYTSWQVSRDPTFVPAVGAMALFLAATVISLWVPHGRIWIRFDEEKAHLAARGFSDRAFKGLGRQMALALRHSECGEGA